MGGHCWRLLQVLEHAERLKLRDDGMQNSGKVGD